MSAETLGTEKPQKDLNRMLLKAVILLCVAAAGYYVAEGVGTLFALTVGTILWR